MDLLNKLNTLSSTFMRMGDLETGQRYPVNDITQMTTKYGDKIVVQLDDGLVCLPSRCDKMASEYLKLMDEQEPLFLVYLGTKNVGGRNVANMFRFER